MKILIYGAGTNGKLLPDLLKKEYEIDCDIVGYIDRAKCGQYMGYPVYKPEDMKDAADFPGAVIIAIADFEIAKNVCAVLKEKGYTNIYWFAYKKPVHKFENFFIEQCSDCRLWTGSILKQVEMHVMDACNLNCRGCTHYSPIFPRTLPNLQERILDVKRLKEKFTHIVQFYILGGEPFLNPEIADYIQEIRNILPDTELYIVTNGLLIPNISKDILASIKSNSVRISISEYEPTHKKIDSICNILDTYEILYEIRGYERKQKFCLPLSLSENSKYPQQCISNGCVTIWNGKIARCPSLMYIGYFNSYFNTNLPEEGVMSLDNCASGEQLLELLRSEVPLCRHCVKNEVEWSVCGKNAKIEDFVTYE